jgi:chaperonin GroEL
MELKNVQLSQLGTAERVVSDINSTLISNGGGSKEAIEARCESIRGLLTSDENTDEETARLKTRLAKLKGGVAVLKVGGTTQAEMIEKKDRIDDALCATKAANEEGYLAGGGCALLHCRDVEAITDSADEMVGFDIVLDSIAVPFAQILTNGGIENIDGISQEILSQEYGNGFNLKTEQIEDLFKAGVIDPAKVMRCALENAASMANIFLTTEAIVTDPIAKN